MIALKPNQSFPDNWKYTDNSCARAATIDKFRISQIELKYPMTFKMERESLNALVEDWLSKNKYSASKGFDPAINSTYYHFSNYKVQSLFGMINDVHLRVAE
eukprot:CAMPEP_0168325116 /NCGR_PEP_ID=MMETSP0213-20121227/4499_1 /TAXON_ID=151035 /ORGANISM="Euplotes harpa, Strain FSP1.4" /LENGTH=101 /DNA_ID=CAMNT_0008327545 /DNA_START=336 /DNA_END=641 /DNA_ORIENTATION=+